MAHLACSNGVSKTLPPIPKLANIPNYPKKVTINAKITKATDDVEQVLLTTRRVSISIASISLLANSSRGIALADDNGFWLTTPLPVPSVENKIANEETGTRSFLKKGIYMANIGTKGSAYRLNKYAFDLLALEDMIGSNAWNYIGKYLRLKSTFMYHDFDKVISAASESDKPALLDLANRLFDSVEKLEDAVKAENLPQTKSCYLDTTAILQEVRTRIA
ncbi:Oxygen-evolving enhancer protein 3 [Dillenia turbinata]|uniref:Oxygen-evolving enhancer protein 3 n=1 Tax=Dillenia turbinata TaxID=194707 RepID=A0AAN8W5Z2_9MAGN